MTDRELDELFSYANGEVKTTEVLDGQIVVPALNELRNGTEHRSRAQQTEDPEEREAHRTKAKAHYTRAACDAIEARIMFRLSSLRKVQEQFGEIARTEDIPAFRQTLDAARTAQQYLVRMSQATELPDLPQLQQTAAALDAQLSRLFENQAVLQHAIGRRRAKTRSQFVAALIGFAGSLLAAWLTFSVSPRHQTPEISDQIAKLGAIQSSLEELQRYVTDQKTTLSSLDRDVTDLRSRKEELERVVAARNETVTAILKQHDESRSASRWKEIAVSFLVGFFSSLMVTLLVKYWRRLRELTSLANLQKLLRLKASGESNM